MLKSPDEMWDLFQRYVEHTKMNPVIKRELSSRTGEVVEIPIDRPLTIEGFFTFAWDRLGDIHAYVYNKDGQYNEFSTIVSRVKEAIRENQISGGVAGLYNANLTARLNGLQDKVQNEVTTLGSISVKFEKDKE